MRHSRDIRTVNIRFRTTSEQEYGCLRLYLAMMFLMTQLNGQWGVWANLVYFHTFSYSYNLYVYQLSLSINFFNSNDYSVLLMKSNKSLIKAKPGSSSFRMSIRRHLGSNFSLSSQSFIRRKHFVSPQKIIKLTKKTYR